MFTSGCDAVYCTMLTFLVVYAKEDLKQVEYVWIIMISEGVREFIVMRFQSVSY